jgi:hypothetical protein
MVRLPLLAEELAVFLAHPVHAFAGCFHLFWATDTFHEIIECLLQLGFDLVRDGLGRIHGGCSFLLSVTTRWSGRKLSRQALDRYPFEQATTLALGPLEKL